MEKVYILYFDDSIAYAMRVYTYGWGIYMTQTLENTSFSVQKWGLDGKDYDSGSKAHPNKEEQGDPLAMTSKI